MKKVIVLAAAALLTMLGCTAGSESVSETASENTSLSLQQMTLASEEVTDIKQERIYPDNAYRELTDEYFSNETAAEGTVVRFTYETKNHLDFNENSPVYEKSALVYLPAGYDENDTETKYNVMYLMHGGSDSPEWFLNGEGETSYLSRMLDTMTANGEIEPMILCAVSYYTDYCRDDTQNCINFHHELINDIIPAFEKKYHTFAEDVTPEGIAASRRHRAFGGFSMGAVTTWSAFEYCLDEIAYFMPISGDCWSLGSTAGGSKPVQTAERLASKVKESGVSPEGFYIYAGCGGYDMANPNLVPQTEAMKELTDTFIYCDNFSEGNLYHCLYEKGGHDRNTVLAVMFNGLPKMFG